MYCTPFKSNRLAFVAHLKRGNLKKSRLVHEIVYLCDKQTKNKSTSVLTYPLQNTMFAYLQIFGKSSKSKLLSGLMNFI
jgi:hypothetical protein